MWEIKFTMFVNMPFSPYDQNNQKVYILTSNTNKVCASKVIIYHGNNIMLIHNMHESLICLLPEICVLVYLVRRVLLSNFTKMF